MEPDRLTSKSAQQHDKSDEPATSTLSRNRFRVLAAHAALILVIIGSSTKPPPAPASDITTASKPKSYDQLQLVSPAGTGLFIFAKAFDAETRRPIQKFDVVFHQQTERGRVATPKILLE